MVYSVGCMGEDGVETFLNGRKLGVNDNDRRNNRQSLKDFDNEIRNKFRLETNKVVEMVVSFPEVRKSERHSSTESSY